MKLYYSTASCSLAPHIVMREIGVPVELEPVGLKGGHYKGGDFKNINPKGYVPTLQLENGEILTEVAVILQYLSDQHPEKKLMPAAGTFERYRCLEWMNYIATELHKGFSPLFSSYPSEVKQDVSNRLKERMALVEKQLKKEKYLLGNSFSVADAYLFTVLNWSGFVRLDISDFTAIGEYLNRVRERPSVQEALRAEK